MITILIIYTHLVCIQFQSAINFVSYLTLPIMIKLFHWHDLTITILCITSGLSYCVAILMAKTQAYLYVASILNIMAMMTTTPIRAHLSKLVGPDDVGKVKRILELNISSSI